jgi:hypothetical protein
MSSFKEDLDRERFKKHAKELTTIICEKEKRNPKIWPPRGSSLDKFLPDGFAAEKKGKIKAFATDYVQKLVARKGAKGSAGNNAVETPASTSQSQDTPRESTKDEDLMMSNSVHFNAEGTFDDSPLRDSPQASNMVSPASKATTATAAPETPQASISARATDPIPNHA